MALVKDMTVGRHHVQPSVPVQVQALGAEANVVGAETRQLIARRNVAKRSAFVLQEQIVVFVDEIADVHVESTVSVEITRGDSHAGGREAEATASDSLNTGDVFPVTFFRR